MILFITLTRAAADKPVRVNVAAVAYLDRAGDATNVAFGSGETLRVAETVEQIEERIATATTFSQGEPQPTPLQVAATVEQIEARIATAMTLIQGAPHPAARTPRQPGSRP